jgi:hypothetical protein
MKKIIVILIIVLLGACEKDKNPLPTELPPITEEGKNTFGCLIENEIYVPEKRRTTWSVPGPQFEPIEFSFPQYPNYTFRVSTIRLVDEDDDLMDAEVEFMVDSCILKPGKYKFSHISVIYENEAYSSHLIDNDSLIITKIDTINNIISGQFSAILTDVSTYSKFINITKGRFDLKK